MKISKKKLRRYNAIEFCGQALYWLALAVVVLCNMVDIDMGVFASAGWILAGVAIWCAGANLKAGLYVCPNCGRKLLIKRVFWYLVIVKELPAFCETCGWRVQFEEK